MYDTAEIRWILHGSAPAALERWFIGDQSLEPETRTDHYVVMPGCASVGIKLRDAGAVGPARLDVKARLGPERPLRVTADIAGRAAAWSKWTLVLTERGAILSGLEPPTPTLTTSKRRLLRRYRLGDGGPAEIPGPEAADDGCDVELTTISVGGLEGTWWSLGFEAFGAADRVWDTLHAALPAWFEAQGPPPLDPPDTLDPSSSTAYPAWLLGRLADARQAGR